LKIRKAVIPAAGLGTRFLPFTKAVAKEMLPIVDKPALQLIVEEIVASGITDILIVTGRNKQNIENHFDAACELERTLESKRQYELLRAVEKITNMANIYYVRQKEAKGLGHAVLTAKYFVGDEPFAVLLGDDVVYTGEGKPCLKQLTDAYGETGHTVLGVQRVRAEDTRKYGIIRPGAERNGRLCSVASLVEKPKQNPPSDIAVLGRYVLSPAVFGYLESQPPGLSGEIQLTDAVNRMLQTERVSAYEFEGRRYDIGDKNGYLEATVEYALRDAGLAGDFWAYLKALVGERG
jgi:UTP--glucose-1-phosphate uridylyltransferase